MKNLKGTLILLLTAMIWGIAFVAQSEGMKNVGPFTFNGIRSIIGGITLLPVVFFMSRKKDSHQVGTKKDLWLGGILCGILLGCASSLQQIGISKGATSGKAGFITALYIIIVPLFQLFSGKKLSLKIISAIILAMAGMYFLCMSKDSLSLSTAEFYIFACAILFSLHILVIDRFSPKVNGVAMSCIQFFVAGSLCTVCMFLFETPELSNVLKAYVPILYAGVLSCGVAYTLQIIGQKHTPPALASIVMSLESVFAALGGWIILGQEMTSREILGAVFMLVAIVSAQLPKGFTKSLFLKKQG